MPSTTFLSLTPARTKRTSSSPWRSNYPIWVSRSGTTTSCSKSGIA
jgi:hypothetical protein